MSDTLTTSAYKEIHQYLQDRSIESHHLAELGWAVMGQTALLKALNCSASQFPFHAALFIPTGPQPSPGDNVAPIRPCGQAVAPRSLEIERATFTGTSGSIRNKRNTPGPQHLYTPPGFEDSTHWKDSSVYVCESAVKAAALALRGYRAVSGAGVASVWTQSRGWIAGWRAVSSLIDDGTINSVRVLFDTDIEDNSEVERAARRIYTAAREAYRIECGVIKLSSAEHGKKVGIDDVIARLPDEDARQEYLGMLLCADNVESLTGKADQIRAQLNDEYLLCVEPECIIRRDTGYVTQSNALKIVTRRLNYTTVNENGRHVNVDALESWMDWPGADIVERIDYLPGQPKIVLGERGGHFNLWTDSGCESREGSIQPFLDVYVNAVGREAVDHFLDAMAYMMQHRGGEKLPRIICAVGAGQGTGKSSLAELMGEILGRDNFSSITAPDLVGTYNASFTQSELVLLDDVDRMTASQAAALKRFTTASKLQVNEKYTKSYHVNNSMVFFITANKLAALPLEPGDRRAQVLLFEPRVRHGAGSKHWLDYFAWLDSGGREAIRYHLEHRDIAGLNIHQPIESEGKDRIIGSALSDVDAWALDIQETLGDKCRLITAAGVWVQIYGEEDRPSAADLRSLGQQLAQHFPRANGGRPVKIRGNRHRLFELEPHPNGEWTGDRIRAEFERCGA